MGTATGVVLLSESNYPGKSSVRVIYMHKERLMVPAYLHTFRFLRSSV